jgi:hypothetical protein
MNQARGLLSKYEYAARSTAAIPFRHSSRESRLVVASKVVSGSIWFGCRSLFRYDADWSHPFTPEERLCPAAWIHFLTGS